MLHPKRQTWGHTIRGLSCQGIIRTRDVIVSQPHFDSSASLEVMPLCHERHHDPIFSRNQACHRHARPRAVPACFRATAARR